MQGLSEKLADASLPGEPGRPLVDARRVAKGLEAVGRRVREGIDAPVRVALFGPTGAGKSKIFNSLAREEVSPSGFRRPFTRRSVYLVPEERRSLLDAASRDVRLGSDPEWRDVILVDTTDFDSVEKENREEAERVFDEADLFVFVTDAQKYADLSTWEYLRRLRERGRPTILVLNKVTGDAEARDFRARLEAEFGRPEAGAESLDPISIPELPLDDRTLLDAGTPAMVRIRGAIRDVAAGRGGRGEVLAARLAGDLDRVLHDWRAGRDRLAAYLEGLAALSRRLDERFRRASADLRARLQTEIDPALKSEVYNRLLERIQKIDILRYPRKLLSLPFRGLKAVVDRWLPARGKHRAASEADRLRAETFHDLEAIVLRASEETRKDFETEPRCPGLLSAGDFGGLRLSHDELLRVFSEKDGSFREWVQAEARETASRLTSEHKLKFILTQVIYNTAMVGVQIHTAGGFTIAEAITDSVLSPLVAKAVGIAVSSDTVSRFSEVARARHQSLLSEILEAAGERFGRHLAGRAGWRADFERLCEGMATLEGRRDALVAEFRRGSDSGGAGDAERSEG